MKKVLIPTKLDAIAKELLEANGNYTVVQDAQTELSALAAQHPEKLQQLIAQYEEFDRAALAGFFLRMNTKPPPSANCFWTSWSRGWWHRQELDGIIQSFSLCVV